MNAKQAEFARQYMVDYNATQAYIRAGYSEKGASISASKLLATSSMQAEIAKLQAIKTEQTGITAQRVVAEIAKLAFADTHDLVDELNNIKNLHEVPRDLTAAVSSITTTITTSYDKEGNEIEKKQVKIGVANKVAALEQLAKHLGLYERDNSQKAKTFKVTMPDE